MIDIKVPTIGESINEVTLLKWAKNDGDYVERDEVIAELESEKATFEVNAEQAGVLKPIGKEGDTLKIGDVVAQIDESAAKPSSNGAAAAAPQKAVAEAKPVPAAPEPIKTNEIKASPVAAAIISDKKIDAGSITP